MEYIYALVVVFLCTSGVIYIAERIVSCFKSKPNINTHCEITGDPVIYQAISKGTLTIETNGRSKISVRVSSK